MTKLIKSYDYGNVPNSYDMFKAIALVTMVIDHIGYFLMEPDVMWMRVIGRTAFPIFLFLVGYSGSFRSNGWLLLGGFLVLATALATSHPLLPLNILFAIALWRWIMGMLEKRPHLLNDTYMLWLAMVIFYIPTVFIVEYGTLGLMFAVLGYYTRTGIEERKVQYMWLFTAAFWLLLQRQRASCTTQSQHRLTHLAGTRHYFHIAQYVSAICAACLCVSGD
jgi:hypothetical protein